MRRRKYKLPVIGRLTMAWLIATGALLGGLAYVGQPNDDAPHLMALRINSIERLATMEDVGSNSAPTEIDLALREVSLDTEPQVRIETPDPNGPKVIHIAGGVTPAAYGAPALDRLDQPPMEPATKRPSAPAVRHAESYAANDFDPDEISITIDGQPALSPAARLAMASKKPTVQPIAALRPDLVRSTQYGNVATIGRAGERPSKIYARPFERGNTPTVSLIVAGLGLDKALTRRVIDELPPTVTLSFAPYGKDLEYWANEARDAGHEILFEIPMEHGPDSAEAIGPAGLMTDRSPRDNLKRLEWLMSRFEGYFGATNYLGATFSADPSAMHPVLDRLKASGIVFFDDTGAARRAGGQQDRSLAEIARVIHGTAGDPAVDLAALEQLARRDGKAIGKAYLNANEFDRVRDWAEKLGDKELTLAPASAVFQVTGKSL